MRKSFEEKVVDWFAAHPDRAQMIMLLLLVGEQHILQLAEFCDHVEHIEETIGNLVRGHWVERQKDRVLLTDKWRQLAAVPFAIPIAHWRDRHPIGCIALLLVGATPTL